MTTKLATAVFLIAGASSLTAYLYLPSLPVHSQTEASPGFRELVAVKRTAFASGVSVPVRDLAPAVPEAGKESGKMGRAEQQARSVPNKLPFRKQVENALPDSGRNLATFASEPMPPPGVSFEGISSNDNFASFGFRILPPDTIGDVGPSHYVQAVNSLFRVFDKSGNPLTPPLKMSSLFSVLGTGCSLRDDGDPIVLYDTLADRWVLSQFCKQFPPFRQMIAVSKTGDPTGEYFVYEFVMPNVKLNDYPKLAIWSDAIYMSTDEFFGSDYAGSGAFAFDRSKMYQGDPDASYIYFDLASPTTIRLGGLLPVDLDGYVPPPSGSPGHFVGYTATEYGDAQDAVTLFEFRADFESPGNSTFSEAPGSPIAVPPFDPTSNPGRDDISQPQPGERLDSQSDRLMYRAAYTGNSGYSMIVVNQTVRVSPPGAPYRAGSRVHVLKKTGTGNFELAESSTVGDVDTSRFMGAAAADSSGNIAVGYNTSNEEKQPSIVYTGKLSTDPPGIFRRESQLLTGTGVQTAFGFRWGDYSGLSLDADGCTFWITNQYYSLASQTESPFGWLTRIGSFRFPECSSPAASSLSGTVTDADTSGLVAGAKVEIGGAFLRFTGSSGVYGPAVLPPGQYEVEVSAEGYVPGGTTVTIGPGEAIVADIALEPAAVIVDAPIEVVEESCSVNGAVEPGETATVAVPLSNSGARGASDLIAELLPTAAVINPSPPVSYGSLPSGGAPVSRNFSFTVSSGLKCGASIVLRLRLSDGETPIGEIPIKLNAGKKRIAFSEDFDSLTPPQLPDGWTTSFEGGQSEWTTTDERSDSGAISVFSPDPRLVGLNELATPPINISSNSARLSFRNWYELETTFLRNRLYDGSVLEIKVGDGKWQDIESAGGEFVSGGYDYGLIDACCQNPLAGRKGWSGRSGIYQESEFIDSIVELPASVSGNTVRFRWRVGTDIGTFREGQYLDDIVVSDGYVCDCAVPPANRAPFDFDGDGKTDLSLFKASNDGGDPDYLIRRSSDGSETGYFWGSLGDVPVNADYDGDGTTDLAVLRPSENVWFVFRSSDSSFTAVSFGIGGDIPAPADIDGDGSADITVFRPADGTWYWLRSSDSDFNGTQFGVSGDIPVPADFDGDGKDDIAVFRPSSGVWYVFGSTAGFSAVQFGVSGDKPVPGDFDGDGSADKVVYRESDGLWYLLESTLGVRVSRFGSPGDRPLQADIDGDGKRDIALFRPSSGEWYFIRSADSSSSVFTFGDPSFEPVPGIFVR